MDIRTVSRTAAALCLVAGPLALAAPVSVDSTGTVAEQIAAYAAAPGRSLASNLLVFPLLLLVPAMVYAARLARPGSPRLAFTGGAVSALAWLAGLISLGGGQIALYQASRLADPGGAVPLIEAVNADPVNGALIGVFVLGHGVGMIALGVALWRAHAVARWAAGCFIAYPILHFAGFALSPALDRLSALLLLVSGVMLARAVLRTPDERWDLAAAPERRLESALGPMR